MKTILYSLLLLFSLVSCTEKMDVKLDSTYTRLVVEGKVTTDFQKHFVKLSESSDVFFNQQAPAVTKAGVSLTDGVQTFFLKETRKGYYETTEAFSGIPGKTYHLSISNVDIDKDGKMEEYNASSFLTPPHTIDSVKMFYDDNYYGDKYWLLGLYLKDQKGRDDYYGFACRVNNVLVHDTITEVNSTDDRYFDGNNFNGFEVGLFDQEKQDEILHNNDEITLEVYAFNKEYHDYLFELQSIASRQNPLTSGVPANIRSNVSNGAIGFFTAYSISRAKTRLIIEE